MDGDNVVVVVVVVGGGGLRDCKLLLMFEGSEVVKSTQHMPQLLGPNSGSGHSIFFLCRHVFSTFVLNGGVLAGWCSCMPWI